jgi:hypothetical protein
VSAQVDVSLQTKAAGSMRPKLWFGAERGSFLSIGTLGFPGRIELNFDRVRFCGTRPALLI